MFFFFEEFTQKFIDWIFHNQQKFKGGRTQKAELKSHNLQKQLMQKLKGGRTQKAGLTSHNWQKQLMLRQWHVEKGIHQE